MVEGGTGGARVAETRSKRAGWRTLGVQNALSMDTGRAGARGRSHNCLFVSDFVARLGAPPDGFLIDGHSKAHGPDRFCVRAVR